MQAIRDLPGRDARSAGNRRVKADLRPRLALDRDPRLTAASCRRIDGRGRVRLRRVRVVVALSPAGNGSKTWAELRVDVVQPASLPSTSRLAELRRPLRPPVRIDGRAGARDLSALPTRLRRTGDLHRSVAETRGSRAHQLIRSSTSGAGRSLGAEARHSSATGLQGSTCEQLEQEFGRSRGGFRSSISRTSSR